MEDMTIGEWLDHAAWRLSCIGIEADRLEATVLAAAALGVDRSWVLAHAGDKFDGEVVADRLLARRIAREPLAYIVGRREFFGRDFRVGPGVLVPRHETETLVEAAIATAPRSSKVVDIGTGSGCVAITVKLERPDLAIAAVDISSEALAYARDNALALDASVEFDEADGIEWLGTHEVDLVVTNPPYVAEGHRLADEIEWYEPARALFAGPDGLEFFRRLAAVQRPGLRLLTEVGDEQAPEVSEVFDRHGWVSEGLWRDLDGRARVLGFRLP